jgi:hypothetical protein
MKSYLPLFIPDYELAPDLPMPSPLLPGAVKPTPTILCLVILSSYASIVRAEKAASK